MTRIEFFEVRGPRWEPTLCRLVEEAYDRGETVYVWSASEAEARRLDELLWTFREDSFVPHALWQGESGVEESVAVGWLPGNPNEATSLVLARHVDPREVPGFRRIVDLAPVDIPGLTQAARDRYRTFRKAGFEVIFHAAGSP